jgi:hypothetical protein
MHPSAFSASEMNQPTPVAMAKGLIGSLALGSDGFM